MRRSVVFSVFLLGLVACDDMLGPAVDAPTNLTYELEPSGDPLEPSGILLRWDGVFDDDLQVYRVYSRPDDLSAFGLRGSTTSTTFHDRGIPDLEYYVVAVDFDDVESLPSNIVLIDERLRLDAPDWLVSTSLNGAIHLAWSDNPYTSQPDGFEQYRVYSAVYSLDENLCDELWQREGVTVAPEFIVSALTNGMPRCFAVSAESIEGFESLWSPIRADTPRPDARNVVVFAMDVDQSRSGFRFFEDLNGDGAAGALELGVVADGARTDIDFRVTRDGGGNFFLTPVRTDVLIVQYSPGPIDDLTSIDIAPEFGYGRAAIQALARHGYVFEMPGGDQFARFGAIRVTHVGTDHIVFDWSYQTDPGNPELSVGAGIHTGGSDGIIVNR